ncbi:hypothetical protein LTR70_010645, partial [Exophiala xenobiotica]
MCKLLHFKKSRGRILPKTLQPLQASVVIMAPNGQYRYMSRHGSGRTQSGNTDWPFTDWGKLVWDAYVFGLRDAFSTFSSGFAASLDDDS